jgi:hypothetical protein
LENSQQQELAELRERLQQLQAVALRLEAERDAHLHVIEQLFKALIPHD